MIEHIKVEGFKAVPHLETTLLMQTHGKCLAFSKEKPNVIVGPNGSGKTALLNALSMLTLTYYTDTSNFDRGYLAMQDADLFWLGEEKEWWRLRDNIFLKGLSARSDLAPALYYRPNRLPGNEDGIAHAMCMGYSREAKDMIELVRNKSSGQRSQNVQQLLREVLQGKRLQYTWNHWGARKEPVPIDPMVYTGDGDTKHNAMLAYYSSRNESGIHTILLDEPEQSLDARAELELWHSLVATDPALNQVICATHSIYPLLHKAKFNIIETVPGYVESVLSLLSLGQPSSSPV